MQLNRHIVPFIICFILLFLTGKISAQAVSPWETVAPPGSYVYTDLKTAIKDANVCYRMEISGTDFLKEKKILSKPVGLNGLIALRMLNNNLTALPSSFNYLPGLKYFASSGNPLTTLSDSLGMWSELRFLELIGTNFDTLPKGIYGCGRLFSLSIASNKDTLVITKEIADLRKTLSEVKIYSTIIDTLPPEIATMPALKKFVFYKCGLKEIPEPVLQMSQLSELWLDSNSITQLPRSISSMKNLSYLSLRGNHLAHIPSTICFLQNLSVLDLRGNPIDPYEIKTLQALLPSCRILF
jgi:Leucine-rich repeat (LRR) protein